MIMPIRHETRHFHSSNQLCLHALCAHASHVHRIQPPSIPEPILEAWRNNNTCHISEAIEPVCVHPNGCMIHLVGVFHERHVSAHRVTAVLDAVQPDMIALELPISEHCSWHPTEVLSEAFRSQVSKFAGTLDKLRGIRVSAAVHRVPRAKPHAIVHLWTTYLDDMCMAVIGVCMHIWAHGRWTPNAHTI